MAFVLALRSILRGNPEIVVYGFFCLCGLSGHYSRIMVLGVAVQSSASLIEVVSGMLLRYPGMWDVTLELQKLLEAFQSTACVARIAGSAQ